MSLEAWNTVASFATFVVICATAVAAIVQLRHMNSNNQIVVLHELRNTLEGNEFQTAWYATRDLIARLPDAAFRRELLDRSVRSPETQRLMVSANNVCNFYENMGMLVKAGFVQRQPVLEMWAPNISAQWSELKPYIAIARRRESAVSEHFEYLAVLSEDFISSHPSGTYPPGVRRAQVHDPWLEEDAAYG